MPGNNDGNRVRAAIGPGGGKKCQPAEAFGLDLCLVNVHDLDDTCDMTISEIDPAAHVASTAEKSGRVKSVPFHLRGNYAPVSDEVTAFDLQVIGEVPAELNGLYVRNGANPVTGTSAHWFLGNGMLHGVRLRDGKAEWYRNRYVKTPLWADPDRPMFNDEGSIDRIGSAANTHIVCHSGNLLALEEGHFPWIVDSELETVRAHDFDGRLKTAMTAHPKICPDTGEMLAFGYNFFEPYLTYHRVSATGELVQSTDITVPGPTMMHDFNATRNYVIFMDLPVVFDLDLAMAGTMPYHWDDNYGARLGVMPRNGTDADVRWFNVDPCYVFHPINAYEESTSTGSTRIVLDVCRYEQMWRAGWDGDAARLHRWTIDLGTGAVTETPLDDRAIEFGRVADANIGQAYRYGYATTTASVAEDVSTATSIVRYDLSTGASVVHDFGPGRHPGEAAPAVRPGASEELDGYVMTYVHDEIENRTELAIVDASDFAAPPVARILLPQRVPYGFHGSWVAS
jgi:carotenoid cleavage dioxygenase-like enzyme